MLRLATVFSGIGAIEHALERMNIAHEIVFACDNGDVDILTKDINADIIEIEKELTIVVALYVLPFLVLAVFQIGAHTRDCKIFITAIQRGNEIACPRNNLPVFITGGLHGKLVMLKG